MDARVIAVACSAEHNLSKAPRDAIMLIADAGVAGDAHAGATVQHVSRMKKTPAAPNLRQVHLIHAELFDELAGKGFTVGPGEMGENLTTRGIDLLGLATGAVLRVGGATLEVTGLRNPCRQLDGLAPGLMAATLDKAPGGGLIRKAGVMAVVLTGGEVRAGDAIEVARVPAGAPPLEPV